MRRSGEIGLWEALLDSPTFWSEVVLRGALILGLFISVCFVLLYLSRRRRRMGEAGFFKDERGNWTIEFVLMAPLMTIFFVVLGQMTILMRTALVVHYSAYNAARSARVHMPSICGTLAKVQPNLSNSCGAVNQFGDFVELNKRAPRPVSRNYQEIAERAAQKTLVSASPVNKRLACSAGGGCDVPDFFDKIPFQSQLKEASLVSANRQRASYAYDPENLNLELIVGELSRSDFQNKQITLEDGTQMAARLVGPEIALTQGENADSDLGYPVTAKLTFRAHLMFPYFSNNCESGKCLFGARSTTDSSGRKRYYSNINAEVTVY
jgi:hypothetical protein